DPQARAQRIGWLTLAPDRRHAECAHGDDTFVVDAKLPEVSVLGVERMLDGARRCVQAADAVSSLEIQSAHFDEHHRQISQLCDPRIEVALHARANDFRYESFGPRQWRGRR